MILVLSGCNHNPRLVRAAATRRWASSAWGRVAQSTTRSSAYLTSTPMPVDADRHASSRTWRATLASNGEIGEPCGVPASVSVPPRPRISPLAANCAAASTSAGQPPGARPGPGGRRGRCCRTSRRHTAHVGDLPATATIVRRGHPFEGQTLAVFGWMRKQGRLELCLVLPDGSKSLIPAGLTDIDSGTEPADGPETLGSLADLLHARAVADGLIHRAEAQRFEDADEPTEEVPHAATAATGRAERGTAARVGAPRSRRADRRGRGARPADGTARRTSTRGGTRR